MTAPNGLPQGSKSDGERIAKVIARSGLCSRREAEALIGDRRVSVNGAIIESAALDILPSDQVLVDGRPLSLREPPRLWRHYKPKGRVTTHKDPEGRPTVFEALPEGLPRLISVGRLDFNTEGLLLLTNDGDLARHLELPATGWTRRYRVRAFGEVSEAQLEELAGGITVSGMNYGPIEASLEREQGGNVWIAISIREGKNREVRRIMEHLGLTVNRLIRVSFGPFMLGDLEPGQIEEVKTAVLKDQLGPRLSRQLGVKREPVREERRLPPSHRKPAYLRRDPAAGPREERRTPDARPLKRRRILEEGGAGTPKIEFVAENRPRRGRFGEEAGSGRKPRFQSRGLDREEAREPRAPRFEKTARGNRDVAERKPSGAPDAWRKDGARSRGKPDFRRERPENPALDAGAKGSYREPRGRKPFAARDDAGGEDAQRFRAFHQDGKGEKKRPPRRWENAGGQTAGDRKPRPDFERKAERPHHRRAEESSEFRQHGWRKDGARSRGKPDFRREKPENPARDAGAKGPYREPRGRKPFAARDDAGGEDAQRFRTFHRDGKGDKKRPPRRWENAGGQTAGDRKPRPDFERQGERPHPRRGEESSEFRQRRRERPEKQGEARHPSFRSADKDERKPFKARGTSGKPAGRPGGTRSWKSAGGKAHHDRRGTPLRKPGRRPGPETDKEKP